MNFGREHCFIHWAESAGYALDYVVSPPDNMFLYVLLHNCTDNISIIDDMSLILQYKYMIILSGVGKP